tara:strand:+ start:552 stop:863 length:312 start_codon:yes stop_codon:yes gene_type:complete
MTTFVGYDYLVTRKNGENGGKMKMTGVGEFWGKSSHTLNSISNSRNTKKHAQLKQQQKHQQARSIEVLNEIMYASKRRSFSSPTASVFFCDCCWGIQSQVFGK